MYTLPPIMTLQEFEEIIFCATNRISEEVLHDALEVIDYLKKTGMPKPETYAFNSLIAYSPEDFDAKVFLVLAPIYKAWAIDEVLDNYDFFTLFSRVQNVISEFSIQLVMGNSRIEYPITINLPPLLLSVS